MSVKVFEGRINLSHKCVEKLYLDSDTADVKFLVGIDASHSIPAHKLILSAGSPIFEAMFYDPKKENDNSKVTVGGCPEAFKEFLKCFYLKSVRLTSENVFAVTSLCHKFEVTDGLRLCETALQKILTINDTSFIEGYELARRLGLDNTVTFCEQIIKENSKEILKSAIFMESNQRIVGDILKLVSSKCSASEVVNAYMTWAKAACERKKQEPTMANLKSELGKLIEKIPFDELSNKEFDKFCALYDGLLNVAEMKVIISKLLTNNTERIQSRKKAARKIDAAQGTRTEKTSIQRQPLLDSSTKKRRFNFDEDWFDDADVWGDDPDHDDWHDTFDDWDDDHEDWLLDFIQ